MQRVRAVAQTGAAVRVSKALIKAHTETTAKFTTSRLPLFIRAVSDTNLEKISDDIEDNWPRMHPTTDVASVEHLPGKLICVAARVVGDAPTENAVKTDKGTVNVANACIRMENEMVRVAGWRDEVAAVKSLRVDEIYYFEAICVRPIFNQDKKKSVELLVVKGTNITV